MNKTRIDRLLVEKGISESREKAQRLILTGNVLVNEMPATKPGRMVETSSKIRIKGEALPFVGRGGLKLKHALRKFDIDVSGKICLDVGASTGGFTDCLLKNGASKVYAVDVGYGQLDWGLRQDPRVVTLERINIRNIDVALLRGDKIQVVTIDVSFISLKKVFPVIDKIIEPGGRLIALIKPQFEVGRHRVGKGGIVRVASYRAEAVDNVCRFAEGLGWVSHGVVESPIGGAKGNREFLAYFEKPL